MARETADRISLDRAVTRPFSGTNCMLGKAGCPEAERSARGPARPATDGLRRGRNGIMANVEGEIRTLVLANTSLAIGESSLNDDTDLFNAGMTSYQSVAMMMSLEDHFGIMFPDAMIRWNTFQTISALANVVRLLLVAIPSQ
jgi:acyl carrier protein